MVTTVNRAISRCYRLILTTGILLMTTVVQGSPAQALHAAGTPRTATTGTPSVITISGLYQPAGLALDSAGNLYVTDTGANQVVKIAAGTGAQTIIRSGLNKPAGVAVDSAGDVYIADSADNQVIKVAAGTGAQTIVASGLYGAEGVAVDHAGNMYVLAGGGRGLRPCPSCRPGRFISMSWEAM